jgi:hypothetical protein
VQAIWGSAEIVPGETQESRWFAESGIPFEAEAEFRYRSSGGRTGSTKVRFNCGPNVPPNAAPPEITALSITPASGELEAGRTLKVDYTVTAQIGVWLTRVRVSGPCTIEQTFVEDLQPTATRSVVLPLDGCALGLPFVVSVDAADGAAQEATRTLTSDLRLVDTEPPVIYPGFLHLPELILSQTLAGDFFVGDSVRLQFNAVDNHSLGALIWEILPHGVVDSLVVSGRGAPGAVWLRFRPEWEGPIQVRMYARDAGGRTSTVFTTESNAAYVRPTVARPTRSATVSGETRMIAVDTKRDVMYLAQGNDRRLVVFSLATMAVTATLPLPIAPLDLDLTAGGDSLLLVLATRPELGVVDLRQPTLALTTLAIPGLDAAANQWPVGVRVGSNGRAYVTLGGSTSAARRMIEVNVATGTTRPLPGANGGAETGSGLLERSHDRSTLVLSVEAPACLQYYNVAADTFSPCTQPTVKGWRPTVDGTGSLTAIGLDVYDSALRLLPKAGTPIIVGGVPLTALSADGASLFVNHWGLGVVRVRSSDNRVLDRTENPIKPTMLRVSPDGARLITLESNYGVSTNISVIDLR